MLVLFFGNVTLCLPFDTYQIYTDVNGQKPLVFCQAHLQKLIAIQFFHWLILEIFEGVGEMSFVYFL